MAVPNGWPSQANPTLMPAPPRGPPPKPMAGKWGGPPSPPMLPVNLLPQQGIPSLRDFPAELLKTLPPAMLEAAALDPHLLRPELYAEILAAIQQATKLATEREVGRGWSGQSSEAHAPEADPSFGSSPLYVPKRYEAQTMAEKAPPPTAERVSSGNATTNHKFQAQGLAEMRGNRAAFETAAIVVENCAEKDIAEPSREELFGVDSVEPLPAEKTNQTFTPTRGKYKMAMKMTQPLGIMQCSLPAGKGFGAGRGKRI